MTQFETDQGVKLNIKDFIATGGQDAAIFSVKESRELAVKVFLKPDSDLENRITAMVEFAEAMDWAYDKAVGIRAAWPVAMIRKAEGSAVGYAMGWEYDKAVGGIPVAVIRKASPVVGYVMPFLSDHRDLFELSEPDGAVDTHSDFSWGRLLNTCRHIATTVAGFHQRGVVVGDISPHNILIDASGIARFVDCDSFGFRDQRTGREYESNLFMEEYAAPERFSGSGAVATIASDRFSLALLITQVLAGNISPFIATSEQVSAGGSMLRNLKGGSPTLLVSDEQGLPEVRSRIPDAILSLSEKALLQGHLNLQARPSAAIWAEALFEATYQLQTCTVNRWHGYCHPRVYCPWCGSEPVAPRVSVRRSPSSATVEDEKRSVVATGRREASSAARTRRTFRQWFHDIWRA